MLPAAITFVDRRKKWKFLLDKRNKSLIFAPQIPRCGVMAMVP
jgi:hypothetical protein